MSTHATVKLIALLPAALSAGLVTGCAQSPRPATLEHVPAAASAPVARADAGALVVYSAFEVNPPPVQETGMDLRHHTAYDVRDAAGALVTHVDNHAAAFGESPAQVALPAGRYQITARSSGFASVVLPVTILPGRTLVLHLEGEAQPTGTTADAGYDVVRLASGQIVGWGRVVASHP